MPKRFKLPTHILIAFDDDQIRMIDEWRRKQADRPTRSAAVQRLIAQSLATSPRTRQTNPTVGSTASALAGREVDRLVDPSVPPEEQAKRKRRLLKGPSEFRDIRKDHPKSKG